ncbi:hypothetical protein DVA86_31560 [Streptomyces armeniacus]|uniref:Uncharacterized protein n=1 Tax=Streptomyces armeniacus TaxID=83291 RepID=A0A345Y1N6_9ACTN|nr:hypothetical protein DVA86_31560 [Streptomyces armeniacus]
MAGLIGAVIVLVGGKSLAETNVEDVINEHPDVLGLPAGMNAGNIEGGGGMFWDELVSDRADTLAARAMIVVFFAVLLLVFTLLARKGAVWARVLITLTSLVALFPHVLIVGDYEPASVTALSYVALLCGLAALVCCWLPGTHRYGRALKNAR